MMRPGGVPAGRIFEPLNLVQKLMIKLLVERIEYLFDNAVV